GDVLDHLVSVERKSLEDLYACVGASRGRFSRELERLAKLPFPAIVLEASFADLLTAPPFSEVHPHSVIGSLIAWSVKYRIPVWCAGDRRLAAGIVHKILTKALKDAGGGGGPKLFSIFSFAPSGSSRRPWTMASVTTLPENGFSTQPVITSDEP